MLRRVSVLLVDDDEDTHALLACVLERAGYSVETAGNGREALTLLDQIRPSVILLDIEMPVMNGAEFRQRQRQDRDLIRIPTIVMTGSRMEAMLDPAVENVLRKPFTTPKLLAAVAPYCTPAS